MELMWLVYAVENLTYNGDFFSNIRVIVMVGTLAAGVVSILASIELDGDYISGLWKKHYPLKLVIITLILCSILDTVLPTRETAIKMAGAYLLQEVVTHDKTQELGNAAYNAALRQLEAWAEEVPELTEMVVDAGLEKAKTEVVK